jgi:predicted metal-dependent hydrolase
VTTTPPLGAFQEALDAQRFFEAHEILEAYWVDYRGVDRDFYKGLIQAAVAFHHARSGNLAGASAVARRARGHLAPYAPRHGAVDVEGMLDRLSRVVA